MTGDWGELEDYDVASLFGEPGTDSRCDRAPVDRSDVSAVLHLWVRRGDYAETEVQAILAVESGVAFVDASCDTTGWDCQSGAVWVLAPTLAELWPLIGDEARSLFGAPSALQVPEPVAPTPALFGGADRDRVARLLACRLGLQVGSTAPMWRATGGGTWVLGWGGGPAQPMRGRISAAFNATEHSHHARCRGRVDRIAVPSLADLDPADPTLLPDGSRLVDALALAAVYLQVPE